MPRKYRRSCFLIQSNSEGLGFRGSAGAAFDALAARLLCEAQVVQSHQVVSCGCGQCVQLGFPAFDEACSLQPSHSLEPAEDFLDASSRPLAREPTTGFAALDACDVLRDSELLQLLRVLRSPIARVFSQR